jgi:SagB-type dehydrogenase family enzyme
MGFIDSEVDQLLGLEADKEATVALAQIGVGLDHQAGHSAAVASPIQPDLEPLSKEEVVYPIIWATNKESALRSRAEVKRWRQGLSPHTKATNPGQSTFPLGSVKEPPIPLEEVILRRGSTRRFARRAISFEQLSAVISASEGDIPLDFLPRNDSLVDLYFIANDVEGLPSGSYYFQRETGSLQQLKTGSLRNMSGYLCLEQPLFSDASVIFYLMTDLKRVLSSLGNRGYRAAQFEAGIRAGKLYLSSYSLGMGASGSTFYDDAVTEFFSPHAKDKSTMIAVGIGVPAYRARSGSVLPQAGVVRGAT